MFTIQELLDRLDGQFGSVEVYRFNQPERYCRGIHTDTIGECIADSAVDDDWLSAINTAEEVADWDLMDADDYNRTVYANGCETADFCGKILVVVMPHD